MSQERGQEFLAQLPTLGQDLPYDPSLLQQLFAQTSDDSFSSMDDVAQTISHDPGLTAKVLAIANSAYYGLQAEVTSVSRAMAVLGMNEVRTLVLALGVKALSADVDKDILDLDAFWLHGVLTAATCRILAGPLGLDADDLFTAGMLHDLGKLITAMHRPDDWRAASELAEAEDLPIHVAEQRHWGLEHGLIGSMTLSSWFLPPQLTEPVSWHHAPENAPAFVLEAKALSLANMLANHLEDPDESPQAPWRLLMDDLGLDQAEILEQVHEAASDEGHRQLMDLLAA